MATIIKVQRKTGIRWKAIIKDPKGRPLKSKTFTRKGDAKTWASRIESDRELVKALGTSAAAIDLNTLADQYLKQWNGKDTSRAARIAWWVDRIGMNALIDIDPPLIRDHLKEYADGKAKRGNGRGKSKKNTAETNRPRAPATVNRMKAAISALLKFAMEEGHLQANPAHQVAQKTERNQRERYLSDDERKALLVACRTSEWGKLYLLVLMALTTGARQGELLFLRWSDIDFNKRTALLEDTKNGTSRLLTIPPKTIGELRQHRKVSTGLIFEGNTEDRPFEFRKHWIEALALANINDFRFHDLRHSAASYLVMAGATIIETAEVLGHKSLQTTKRYAHLSVEHKQELTDRVLGDL